MMKRGTKKEPLPKFEFVTLDRRQLAALRGGGGPFHPDPGDGGGGGGGCTCGTVSVCHIDGTTDCDC